MAENEPLVKQKPKSQLDNRSRAKSGGNNAWSQPLQQSSSFSMHFMGAELERIVDSAGEGGDKSSELMIKPEDLLLCPYHVTGNVQIYFL